MEFTSIVGLLAGCGVLAAIAYWWSSKSDKKGDIRNAVGAIFKKKTEAQIRDAEEKQKVVVAEIEKSEKLSEESKTKIKEIQKKAAKEIGVILKEESIAKIDEDIDKSWDDL